MLALAKNSKTTIRKNVRDGDGEISCKISIGKEGEAIINCMEIDNAISFCAEMTFAPGVSIGPHSHTNGNSELMIVTEGEIVCMDNDEEYTLHAGDMSYCFKGSSHAFYNRSDKEAKTLCIVVNTNMG